MDEVKRLSVPGFAALRGLPESDYALFDVGRKREAPAAREPKTEDSETAPPEQTDLLAGPLASAKIVPARISCTRVRAVELLRPANSGDRKGGWQFAPTL